MRQESVTEKNQFWGLYILAAVMLAVTVMKVKGTLNISWGWVMAPLLVLSLTFLIAFLWGMISETRKRRAGARQWNHYKQTQAVDRAAEYPDFIDTDN